MSPIHSVLRRFSLTAACAALGVSLLAIPARAQPRLKIPLDARGYQTTVALQQYHQRRAAVPPRWLPAPATAVSESEARSVTITGPHGRVRRFQIEGPVNVVPSRTRVVHWGAR